ncbi:MAG: hypothetical protein II269_02165 [Bacteroidaceae bacterium]|nr:hypothetical protein [Bacteroidaceae bacterium]
MKRFLLAVTILMGSLQAIHAQGTPFQALLSYVQNVYQFSQICQQEKVYLHFDNTAYFQGDIIWFSAYVVNATTQTPAQSKVLYVELLSPNGVVLKQLKLKVENGQAHGSFPLVETPIEEARALRGVMALPSGFYEVRAYTRTMLNFDEAGVFSRVFPVYEAPKKEGDYSNPAMKRWDNPYEQLRPETDKAKTINMTFYPEGGSLVMGVENRVAFKAMDENGMGVAVKGNVQVDKDEAPIPFTTTHDGMGYFDIVPTKKRHTVDVAYGDKIHTFRLPEADEEGYALRVDNSRAEHIRGQLSGYAGCQDELLGVMLICRGAVSYFDTISIKQGRALFVVPKENLPTGIHQLHLFNAAGELFAQRHVFVNNGIAAGEVRVTASATQYAPFEQVKMSVKTSLPDGTPMPATISMAVRDRQNLGTIYEDNVMTNMLLSSELKGYIHSPEFYFADTSPVHVQALDLLMMVQGWTRYNWHKMARVEPFYIKHYVEDGLVIDGYVLNRMKDKPIEGATVKMRLYSPDRSQTQETSVITDENGSFGFSVEEFDGKWDMFLSVFKDGKEQDCRLKLDRASRPTVRAYTLTDTYLTDDVATADDIEVERLSNEPSLQADPDSVFLLDNVDIYGRKKYVDYLTFKAYDAEEDTEFHLDQGNYSYMVRDYLAEKGYNIDYSRYTGVMPETITTREEMMTWALEQCPINNRRVLWYLHNEDSEWMKQSYTPGFDIDMADVKSIIVYDSPFDYHQIPVVRDVLTMEQLEELEQSKDVGDFMFSRGLYVVDISMYPKGLRRSKVKGQRQTSFRGYSEVPDFYAPEYPDGPIQGDVDYRRTLYWNPSLTTDAEGAASVEFYNNGYSKEFSVSAEGISAGGVVLRLK